MYQPAKIVDMHTHVFNAHYVPLYKIFRSKGVWRLPAKLLARLVNAIAGRSSFPDLDTLKLTVLASENQEVGDTYDPHLAHGHHQEELEVLLKDIITNIVEHETKILLSKPYKENTSLYSAQSIPLTTHEVFKQNNALYETLVDIHDAYGDAVSAEELGLTHTEEKPQLFSAQLALSWDVPPQDTLSGVRRMVQKLLKKFSRGVEELVDLLDFALTMMRGEISIYNRLEDYYIDRGVTELLLSHYMMDMEFPYDGKPKHSFYEDQLPRMMKLARYAKGRLVGFSAYCPLRFMNEDASIDEVHRHLDMALAAGCVGFKFYPPMGFRAAGNTNQTLEKYVDMFLDYCVGNNVPVFTHCTPKGFEVRKGSGVNANPKFWRQALNKPGRQSLRLCLGHAGGGYYKFKGSQSYGWLAETQAQWTSKDNYAAEVVALCREFPNVYCEIANIDPLTHSATARAHFKRNLKAQMTLPITSDLQYAFSEKVMYGTDWHMPDMVNDLIKYFNRLCEMFGETGLSEHANKFFCENAVQYLRLGELKHSTRTALGQKVLDGYAPFVDTAGFI